MSNITTKELLKIWGHVALNSFGGPAGQIAVIHKLVVEDKKLVSEERFLHALNFCMLLPGPEAQQLATYMGYVMHNWKGGLIAGGLFILPGFLSILLLSYIYVLFHDLSLVQGLFYGIKPAIIAIVLSALFKISKRSLKTLFYWLLALLSFLALFFLNLSFPKVVIISALIGIIYGRFFKQQINQSIQNSERPLIRDTIKTICIWLTIWFFPIFIIYLLFGFESTFHTINLFFSKMSLVTFGGAYAALSYVAQQAVENFGWLSPTEMLDGLALAESTPGPLIQVVQFVGFMGAFRYSNGIDPLISAFLGSVLTTWMTFAPCFLFIFSFAPYIEYIRGNKIFSDAISAITASIVGVILNLSLWFVLNALFLKSGNFQNFVFKFQYPIFSSLDPYAATICLISLFMQFKLQSSLFTILSTSTILGIFIKFLF